MDGHIRHALSVMLDLERVWGRARLGLALSEAYFDGRCVSSEEIAARTHLSRSTVQDHLKRLLNVGRCKQVRRGRTACYLATEQWATWTRDRLIPP